MVATTPRPDTMCLPLASCVHSTILLPGSLILDCVLCTCHHHKLREIEGCTYVSTLVCLFMCNRGTPSLPLKLSSPSPPDRFALGNMQVGGCAHMGVGASGRVQPPPCSASSDTACIKPLFHRGAMYCGGIPGRRVGLLLQVSWSSPL